MSSIHYAIEKRYGYATTITFALNAAGSDTRKTGATLAAGDFKINRHTGGVWSTGNPTTTTPTEIGTTGIYALPLTATELTPDDLQYPIIVACHDVAGAEWDDVDIHIRVTRLLDTNFRANVGGWNDAAVNALISGRVDSNAQVVGDKTGFTLTTGEHTQVASDVLDATTAAHVTAGTIGKAISDASGAGNPWDMVRASHTTAGTFGEGVASVQGNVTGSTASVVGAVGSVTGNVGGNIVGNIVGNILGTVADSAGVTTLLSRLTATRATYIDLLNTYLNYSILALKSIVDAIKTKTDNLPTDPASETSVETAITTAQSAILVDTGLIKAKTNNLPSSPAAVGSQMDLVNAPNATAISAIQSGLALASNLTTLMNRVGAWTGSGRNTILGALQALFRKDVDATVPTDINTNLGSGVGTADNTTDSTEAIADAIAAISGGAAPSAQTVADAVWDTLRSAHTISGSFGQGVASVQGNVTGSVASVSGNVGGNLNGNVQGNVVGSVASVVGNVSGTVQDSSGVTTLLTRLSATRTGYLDALAGWSGTILNAFKALARKDATASTDIGGTHNPATDSEEALSETLATFAPSATITENISISELNP